MYDIPLRKSSYFDLGGEGAENTSEFVNAFKNNVTKGPDLPMKFKKHCVTWFNETHALFTGGFYAKKETYFVDISDTNNFRWIFKRVKNLRFSAVL